MRNGLRERARESAEEAARVFGGFLRGQALIALVMTAFHAVGFYFIDLDWWWAAALVAGAFSFIPMLGVLLGAIPAVLIAALTGTVGTLLLTLAVLAGAQLFEGLYLGPKILGKQLSLHPAVVFAAAILGGLAFGPLGAFLAAPLAATALALWRRARKGV